MRAYWAFKRYPRFVLRAGRRWGKTALIQTIACDRAVRGGYVGWFVPDYKISSEAFGEMAGWLDSVKASSSKVDGVIRTTTGGRIDFWTLDNDRAGRSRKYDLAVCDEAAFNKANFWDVWERAIEPTLLDRAGRAIFASNTAGRDADNVFFRMWKTCENVSELERDGAPAKPGWGEYHAPTEANPTIPERRAGETDEEHAARHEDMMAKLRAEKPPLVFAQEHEADFVDWSGVAFFDLQKMLADGQPVDYPAHCDAVFATVDTATKTGRTNDGTAVCYWVRTLPNFGPHPLILLDWDIVQIEGALLDVWLKGVFSNLEAYAQRCRARAGSLGAMVEDKSSGMVLLQQALRHGWPAHPIDSKLTAMGKSERALSVASYVYQGQVKLSRHAHEKVVTYKNDTRNHFLSQVLGFRVGDDDKNRADDLLDCFTYAASTALGSAEGW